MAKKQLMGVRVAVLAADGFEQVEVTIPVRALRKAGADVRIISLRPGRIRGVNLIWPGKKVKVDSIIENASPEDYGALYLPGGFVNPDLLRQSAAVRQFVTGFEALGRPIATLCHGPEILISSGLARGRRLTSWPGIADDLRNAGADWQNESLVRDGMLVSSRGPHDLPKFIPGMVTLFADHAPRLLAPLARPTRWGRRVLRVGMVAAAGALVLRARARSRAASRREDVRAPVIATVAGLLAGAAVFGGLAYALRAGGRRRSPISEAPKLYGTPATRNADAVVASVTVRPLP